MTCPKCGLEKPEAHFNKHHRSCKECRAELQRGYVARNYDKVLAVNRSRGRGVTRHEAKCRGYGITADIYAEMLEAQDGVCAICKRACPSGRRLAIDHDHLTLKVRGLLCARCNAGIAQFQDTPALLSAAIDYLKEG